MRRAALVLSLLTLTACAGPAIVSAPEPAYRLVRTIKGKLHYRWSTWMSRPVCEELRREQPPADGWRCEPVTTTAKR